MARDTEYNVDGEGREETSTKTKMSPTQVKKAFQKIMQDFPSSPDEQNKYMEEWTDVITESNAKKMNLMHFVIEENAYECVDDEAQDPSDQDEDRGRHMSLLRWLLNHRPVLLTGQNNEGRTPIHEAARNDGNLLQVILDSFAEFNVPVRKVEPDLKSLIQANASVLGSIEALSNYLVSWSTQFMGMTDVTRVSLTEAIIKYLVDANIAASVDRRAKLPTSVDRRAGFSNLLDRRAGFQPPGEAKSKTDYFRRSIQIICKNNSTCLHAAVENKIRQPSLDALKTIIRLSAADILATPNKDGDTPLHLAVNLESLSTESTELVKELAAKNPTAIYTKNNKGETPYRILTDSNRKSAFQRSSDSSRETKKILEGENGKSNPKEDIEEILKYYWVRERPLLEVAETLYSGNQQKAEKYLYLDLTRSAAPMTQEYLESLEQHVNFESILKWVLLPKPLDSETATSQSDLPPETILKGPSSHWLLFKWLREKKGVQKILEVHVEDDGKVSHSDELIVEALKDFDVEIWDWKKRDICSETIYEAAPNVRKLNLYSSGNNAVLRSWCAVDGLAKLKKGTNSAGKIREHVEKFEAQLKERHPNLKFAHEDVDSTKETQGEDSSSNGDPSPKQSHAWIEHMEEFARGLRKLNLTHKPEVKVALIDDGVEVSKGEYSIATGKDFYEVGAWNAKHYFVAPGGHGTVMARLIGAICPAAKLYVARLHDVSRGKERTFTTKSAIKAVKWATSMDVHIISMSWSAQREDRDGIDGIADINGGGGDGRASDWELLRRAISEADQAGIIMFCSLKDEGLSKTAKAYPQDCPGVIKIGAATKGGHTADYVGSEEEAFNCPGDQVQIADPDSVLSTTKSGSSIATALAAGVAAVILYCVEAVQPGTLKNVRNYSSMKTAFQAMAQSTDGNHRYLRVGDFFKPLSTRSEESLEQISVLVERLGLKP